VNNVNIPKKQYHHGNLREALIKAGMRAVAEDGPDGFSLRGVATRAGVTAPAVYRHFADKDELLAAIAAECLERFAAAVNAALAAAPGDSLARFRAVGIANVQFAVAHPEHFRAMTVPGLFRRLDDKTRAELAAWQQQQRDEILAGQAAGEITNIPVDELLLAANATVKGLAHMIVEGQLGPVDAARAKQLAIAVTGALGVGFIPRDKPPSDPLRPAMKRKRS
jgi:AcrR family transcriptional regulator